MEQLKGGIYITPKDIMALRGSTSLRSAQREHQVVRDALGITSSKLTVHQYCTFRQLNEQEVIYYLNPYR